MTELSSNPRSEELVDGAVAGSNKSWNWHPDIPIEYAPIFVFPPKPVAALKWFSSAWLPFTELTVYFLLAVAVWAWVQPPLDQTTLFSLDWLLPLWLRNVLMMTFIATALHLWLHRYKRQGDKYRFMRSAPTATGKQFIGGTQLRDNVFWVLVSGVSIWTIYEAALWWAYANGYAPTITFSEHPIWFVLWLPLIGIWFSFHFYWVHRFLHWKPLYSRFHSVHHRNVTIGPWSGLSMHPVEHLLYISSLLIHFVVPSHPIHMLFHCYWLTLATATSHSGYQELMVGDSNKVTISTFFHQLHHRYFTCNYGNLELPMDKWFGSFNNGSSKETARLRKKS